MICKFCGKKKKKNKEYGFDYCEHTNGDKCLCGHWHKVHMRTKGCKKCDCKKFAKDEKSEQGDET